MAQPNGKFLRAVGAMIGSIVGVGVFGLPYTFAQSGWVTGMIVLVFMAGMLITLQLMYAEVCTQTEGKHRLVGYIREYVGKPWDWVSLVALASGLWGAMIAYIIVGGRFMHILLGPLFGGPEVAYSLVLAFVASALMYKGLQFVSKIDTVIIVALLFLFLFMVLAALPHLELANVLQADVSKAFVPYGVVLFSLAGIGVVPEMKEILGPKQEGKLGYAIVIAMLVITLLYAGFTFAVVGVTGSVTTEAAFDGLVPVLGPTFALIGALLGSLTILSIYMLLGIQLQNTMQFDFGMKKLHAWILVCGVPIVLFLLGLREFIDLIGFIGGVFVGILGILIVLTYERMRRSPVCKTHRCLNLPHVVSWMIMLLFLVGVVLNIASRLS